jgi:hypothetical protein
MSKSQTETGAPLDRAGRCHALDLDDAAVTQAARALGRLRHAPRQKDAPDNRTWTGVLFGRRVPVGMAVVLDGEPCWIKRVMRGWACVRTSKVDPIDGPVHEYCQVSSLRRFKLPQAVSLGRLKSGVKERKSAVKAVTSRANGGLPPKPGSLRRGRPRIRVA